MCLEINFIKICPEIALKFFFLNVVLYEIYSKKSKVKENRGNIMENHAKLNK
jgi:hypothetical protein